MKASNRKVPLNRSEWVNGLIEWFDPDKGYGIVSFEGSENRAFLQANLMSQVAGYQINTHLEHVPVKVMLAYYEPTGFYNVRNLSLT